MREREGEGEGEGQREREGGRKANVRNKVGGEREGER